MPSKNSRNSPAGQAEYDPINKPVDLDEACAALATAGGRP
jgi:hypothetical protein